MRNISEHRKIGGWHNSLGSHIVKNSSRRLAWWCFFAILGIGFLLMAIFISASNTLADPSCKIDPPEELAHVYVDAAALHPDGLTECELISQDYHESLFDPDAQSPAGAAGIAQFEPETAAEFGIDPLDPVASIHAQAAYMDRLMHVWRRHEERSERVALALGSYNWGIGNMLKSQLLHGWNTWESAFGFLPRETQNYVTRIRRDSK